MNKVIIALLSLFSVLAAHAQDDDWQIGGGAYRNNGAGTSYNRETQRATFNDPLSSNVTTLWNGGHDDAQFGLQFGYVNKQWVTDFDTYTWRGNMWGDKDKRLHGFQMGFVYQPCLKFGLGAHTGIFYEGYISECSSIKDQGWDKFYEHNLYIPVHAMYRLPITYNMSLMLYGGIGFNWAIYGEYREHGWVGYDSYGDSHYYGPHETQDYGERGWPKRVNFSGEFGATFRYKSVQASFTYSLGLTNHKFYPGMKTRQDKLSISLAFVTGDW